MAFPFAEVPDCAALDREDFAEAIAELTSPKRSNLEFNQFTKQTESDDSDPTAVSPARI